ncbi:DUF3168 domain-containing protein [Comamonas antarctica]|uniref:tail completion protein gp17 n=1 Tax=Comamonas antarctica TaxID=2743470 RepID=UPI0028E1B54C|nr:DUF3168 domain-containing protein [Comamonas antarctica]
MDEPLHAAIAAVIPNCYGTVAPANAPEPYVIWQRIGGNAAEYLDNEDPQVDEALVQVEIFDSDILAPKALMKALTTALRGHPDLTVRPDGGLRDDYDHDMQLFSAARDFNVSF